MVEESGQRLPDEPSSFETNAQESDKPDEYGTTSPDQKDKSNSSRSRSRSKSRSRSHSKDNDSKRHSRSRERYLERRRSRSRSRSRDRQRRRTHIRRRSRSREKWRSRSRDRRSRSRDRRSRSRERRSRSRDRRSRSRERRSRSRDRWRDSRSPRRRDSRSPRRRDSCSPRRRDSRSPRRRDSRSPKRRDSRSPRRRDSRSPRRRDSRSPLQRDSSSPRQQDSPSPQHRDSRSPRKRGSLSPKHRNSRSPRRRFSRSPRRFVSRSPRRRVSGSPRRRSVTPQGSLSPRRRSPYRERSPLISLSAEERDARIVYVMQLSKKCRTRDIDKFFSDIGKIRDIRLVTSNRRRQFKGIALVEFKDPESAILALGLSGQKLLGYPVLVQSSCADYDKHRQHDMTHRLMPKVNGMDNYELRMSGPDYNVMHNPTMMSGPYMTPEQVMAQTARLGPSPYQIQQQRMLVLLDPPIATQCFLLSNLFDPNTETRPQWDLEIRDDIIDECNKYGGLLHIFVDRASSHGMVYVKCTSIAASVASVNALHNRWFGGRRVIASYVPVPNYHNLFPDAVNVSIPITNRR